MSNKRKLGSQHDEDEEMVVEHKKKKKKYVQFIEEDDEEVSISQEIADFDIPPEAEVGVIEKVSLINFMCHAKLEVKLGPHVNFIIGRNGSGKSAILSGIIVGLGGKAFVTNRGSSLRNFIKEGCSFGSIAITLRNRGTDAYKASEYGESIVVERRISRDGQSVYKIKNGKSSKIISNKKDELIAILDQFNIQIDNPVSILTQDTARSFLNNSDKKNKYSLFLKATQLEQMSSNYQEVQENKNINKQVLEKKMRIVQELYNHVKELEEKYKDMQKLQDLKLSVVSLKKELAWAFVAEKKQEAEEAENASAKYEAKIPSYQKKIQDIKDKGEVAKKEMEVKKEQLSVATEEAQSHGNKKTELGNIVKKKKQALKFTQDSRRKIEKEINNAERDKRTLKERIQELKCTAQRDLEAEQNERDRQIEQKENKLQQYKAQLSTSVHHMNQVTEAIKGGQKRKYDLSKDINFAKDTVEKVCTRLDKLQGSQQNSLAAFGSSTVSIRKVIDQYYACGKFHKKPFGPMGSLIKLKDAKWAIAVEQCLKGSIEAYACHDGHDMMLLKSIFKKYRSNKERTPLIIVSSFLDCIYDVSRNKPYGFTTVMDMLVFDNPVVANTLIDQCSIETTLLIESAKEAQKVIWQDRPPSKKAISIEGHEIMGGRFTMYYPCRKKDAKFLQADIQLAIRKCEEELRKAQQVKNNLIKQITILDQDIRKEKNELESVKRKCREEQDQVNNIEAEIQDLRNIEIEQPPDVTVLESELEEIFQKIKVLDSNLTDKNLQVDQQKDELRQQMEIYNEWENKCNAAIERLEKLADEDVACQGVLDKLTNDQKFFQKKFDEIMGNIQKAKQHHEKLVKEYEETRAQALEYCSDEIFEPSADCRKLESKITQTEKRVEREETRRGNCEEVVTKYNTALQKYTETKKCIKSLRSYSKSIEKALTRRAKRYEKFQQALTLRARKYFDMMLAHRGYSGRMKIDHEEETLQIAVNVENAKGATTKDSRALSGGERSFSTICFIMSMWEAMEAPFRCLDEFDVFMDMLNRRIAMTLLMDIAKQQDGRQFILLTPLDMSNIAGSDKVRILKLNDPERGQQRITFQPVNGT